MHYQLGQTLQMSINPLHQQHKPLSDIKLIVSDAINQAVRSKVIDDKGNNSIVIYGLRENHKDPLDAKNIFDITNCSYRILKT